MIYRAFKQYIRNNLKDHYSVFGLCESLGVAGFLVALTIEWLMSRSNSVFYTLNGYFVCIVLVVTYTAVLPLIRTFLGALFYGIRFYGHYEVIERYYGYRAFRITREQQDEYGLRYEGADHAKVKIIASAIQSKEDGIIWCVMRPGRHHHCIAFMAEHDANKQEHRQGFLTNHYRYIGREEARTLALHNGQAPNPAHCRDLFSEDLWDTPPHLCYKG